MDYLAVRLFTAIVHFSLPPRRNSRLYSFENSCCISVQMQGSMTFHRPLFPFPTNHEEIVDYIFSRIRVLLVFRCKYLWLFHPPSSTFPFPHESPRNGRLYSFVFYYRSDVNIYDFSPPSSTFPFPHELRRNSRLYFKFIHQIHITDSFENLCFISVQMQGSTTFHRPLFPSLTNHEGTADYILSRIRVLLAFRCKYRRLFTAIIHFSFPPRITKE